MSEIGTLSSNLSETIKERLYSSSTENNLTDRLERIKEKMQNLPSVLDSSTLQKLRDGEYEISLKEYSNMNTYRTMMDSLYGDKSADAFQNYLDKIFEEEADKVANAKSFVEKMRENGMSNSTALKLYSAIKTYSLVSSFKNYNFIKAKI